MAVTVGNGKGNRKRLKLILAVSLLIVLGLGVGVYWPQQQDGAPAEPDTIAEVTTEAQNQVFEGKYDQAHETINQALDNPNLSEQAKITLYMQQAAAYESQQNYEAALRSYRQAETLGPDAYGVALSIANLASLTKNRELALTYFKKALALLPDDDPLRDQNRQYLESWIAIWEAGGPEENE